MAAAGASPLKTSMGLAAALVLIGSQAAASGRTAEGKAPAGDKDAKICRDFGPPIGTRIGNRRVCATEAEWKLMFEAWKADTRTGIEKIQNQLGL